MEIVSVDRGMLEAVAPLVADFRVVLRGFKGEEAAPDLPAAREELEEFLDRGFPVYSAMENGRALGYLVCRVDGGCVWVEHIFVAEGARRRGLASALYDRAQALAESMGEDTLYNYVHPNNDGMIAFLRAKGYTVLNLIEIRRPWRGEKPSSTVRVNGHAFDY